MIAAVLRDHWFTQLLVQVLLILQLDVYNSFLVCQPASAIQLLHFQSGTKILSLKWFLTLCNYFMSRLSTDHFTGCQNIIELNSRHCFQPTVLPISCPPITFSFAINLRLEPGCYFCLPTKRAIDSLVIFQQSHQKHIFKRFTFCQGLVLVLDSYTLNNSMLYFLAFSGQ